ncbi:2-acylglycerol O-acyltransferase 3 isoform X4 [Mauremys mutica]|uniref:2-acylglycerol O-acyltransferase 3 isoform X4 n=1 Tax=Mauremys mutica TaxID=74926 RepID=UPI001D141C43|nr:2-acylglycerol O-acyltransferase 3 isoform X4 [Mauremys mutica]
MAENRAPPSRMTGALKKHLELLSVFQWVMTFLFFGAFFTSLLFYLLFTRLWAVSVLYFVWWVLDRDTPERGGRRSDWMRRWRVWQHLTDYYPVKLVKTAALPPDRSYVLGSHPHGIMCAGAAAAFCTEGPGFSRLFPGLRPSLALLAGLFRLPLYREDVPREPPQPGFPARPARQRGGDRGGGRGRVAGLRPRAAPCHPATPHRLRAPGAAARGRPGSRLFLRGERGFPAARLPVGQPAPAPAAPLQGPDGLRALPVLGARAAALPLAHHRRGGEPHPGAAPPPSHPRRGRSLPRAVRGAASPALRPPQSQLWGAGLLPAQRGVGTPSRTPGPPARPLPPPQASCWLSVV